MDIQALLTEHPKYFAVFIILAGVFFILAAVLNWDWIFKGNSYNTQKIEGTANVYGRGFARLKFALGGAACIIGGIVWLVIG